MYACTVWLPGDCTLVPQQEPSLPLPLLLSSSLAMCSFSYVSARSTADGSISVEVLDARTGGAIARTLTHAEAKGVAGPSVVDAPVALAAALCKKVTVAAGGIVFA